MNTASPAPAIVPVPAPANAPAGPKRPALTNVEDAYFKLAEDSSAEFDSLKKVIKLTGDMFAFGEPTLQILELLAKVYNENIMRILSKNVTDKPGEQSVAGKDFTKFRCMLGVLQVQNLDPDKQIYVTISESPGFDEQYDGETDILYKLKRQMALNLFKSANITVNFPEQTNESFAKFGGKPTFPADTRWRRTESADDWNTLYEYDAIKQTIFNDPILKSYMFLDKNLFIRNSRDKVNVYSSVIRNKSITVNWIDSIEYLKRRIIRTNASGEIIEASQKTFRPYKKYKFSEDKRKVSAECNNGHLCTESKLFAYAHMNELKPMSFVAYWIENILPPHHIIRPYCYRTEADAKEAAAASTPEKVAKLRKEISKETELLNALTKRCIDSMVVPSVGNNGRAVSMMGGFYRNLYESIQAAKRRNTTTGTLIPAYTSPEKVYEKFFNLIRVILQPAAVACPGCFANIQAYKEGDMTLWNSRNCYVERQRMPSAVVRTGGKRMTRRKVRKGKKHTRKH